MPFYATKGNRRKSFDDKHQYMMYTMGYEAGYEHGWRESLLTLATDENREIHESGYYATFRTKRAQEHQAARFGYRDVYNMGWIDGQWDGKQAHLKSREEKAA